MGPLKPQRPIDSRVLLFSDNPVSADYASARWIGFDPARLPIVRQAPLPWSIFRCSTRLDSTVVLNGSRLPLGELGSYCDRPFEPPPGWIGHVERVELASRCS